MKRTCLLGQTTSARCSRHLPIAAADTVLPPYGGLWHCSSFRLHPLACSFARAQFISYLGHKCSPFGETHSARSAACCPGLVAVSRRHERRRDKPAGLGDMKISEWVGDEGVSSFCKFAKEGRGCAGDNSQPRA